MRSAVRRFASPSGWLGSRTALRATSPTIPSRGQSPTWVELNEEAVWVDAEEEAEMADRKRRLQEAMGRLDPTDRRILALAVVEGRSSHEVAATLGLSAEAVRARKSRALK